MKPTSIAIGALLAGVIVLGITAPILPQEPKTGQPKDTVFTYRGNILPMLQANCNPCHFPGGKMYKKLPFDDYKTVATLGKKLNTRFKEKKQQATVNGWVEHGVKMK